MFIALADFMGISPVGATSVLTFAILSKRAHTRERFVVLTGRWGERAASAVPREQSARAKQRSVAEPSNKMSYKLKTHSGAKKRFKKTASGKIKRGHAFIRHILTSKSTKKKRKLDLSGMVSDADTPKIKRMIPY